MTVATPIETAPALTSLYQVMPSMDAWDYKQLKESISECFDRFGVPFWPGDEPRVDGQGRVVDGHHRMQACAELGFTPTTRAMPEGFTDDDVWKYAFRVNLARRQLTIEQRRGLAREYLLRYPAATLREAAQAAGVSDHTVRAVRQEMEGDGEIPVGVHRGAVATDTQTRHDDEERSPLQYQNHRKEAAVEIIVHLPGVIPEGDPRDRAGLPYPKAAEPMEWSTGLMILTEPQPRNPASLAAFATEALRRFIREAQNPEHQPGGALPSLQRGR